MKSTQFFQFRRKLPDRADITDELIKSVIETPIKTVIQDDGRIKVWGRAKDAEGKYLRVVLLEDGETVHNAFFDRTFKE